MTSSNIFEKTNKQTKHNTENSALYFIEQSHHTIRNHRDKQYYAPKCEKEQDLKIFLSTATFYLFS